MVDLIYLYYSVFVICSAIIVWIYVMYPLLVAVLARGRKLTKDPSFQPFFSIVIPAHNETQGIKEKIQNALSLSYPREKFEIIIVDDASVDNTAEIVSQIPDVKLVRLKSRQGKSAAVNAGLKEATGGFILLTDADCMLDSDSLTFAAQHFNDLAIGAVAGHVYSASKSSLVKDFARRENWLAQNESLLDSIPTGTGAFLTFRKNLVGMLDPRCLADDVEISAKVRSKGYRVVYDNRIKVNTWEPDLKLWFHQTVRRTLQGLTTLSRYRFMFFRPKYGWYGMMIFPTRLLLHRLSPFLLVLAFVSSWLIDPLITFSLGAIALLLILLLPLFRKMLLIQVVFFYAWLKYIFKRHGTIWERGPRGRVN